jgi:hypothetical protein
MIEDIISNGEKSITPIHGIAMTKYRLPDLTFHYRILQRLETQICHSTSSRLAILRQILPLNDLASL